MKSYLFSVLLALCFLWTSGQSTNPFPSNTMTTPSYNGKAFTANHYIGQPIINFPLYSYKDNYMSYELTMNYNATGTQVDQVASVVGLGWQLQSAGFIKRTVVGAPDEFTYTVNSVVQQAGYLNSPAVNLSPTRAELDDWYNNKKDGQADIYNFNIPGYSGRMIIDKNNLVVGTIPESNLRITFTRLPNNGRINQFTIKTEEGLEYQFTEEEVIKYKTKIDNVEYTYDYTSAWWQTSVRPIGTTGFGNAITFNYTSYTSNETIGAQWFSGTPADPNITSGLGSICYLTQGGCCIFPFAYLNEPLKTEGTLKRLSSIGFPDGSSVGFTYTSNNRCDLIYDVALQRVQVAKYGHVVKAFQYEYSYWSKTGETTFTACNTLDYDKRLLLNKIAEYGADGSSLPPYLFKYETSIQVAERSSTSTKIDQWGFYDSLPNVEEARAYVLKEIVYPTGAFVKYDFELNTIGWTKAGDAQQTINGLRLKKITTNEGTGATPVNDAVVEMAYSYDLADNTSSGQVDYLPIKEFMTYLNLNKITSCSVLDESFYNAQYRNRINHSPIEPFKTNNACGYSRVTEEIRSGTSVLSKNIYYFKNYKDYINTPVLSGQQGNMVFPFPSKQYHIAWGLGLLWKTEAYDDNGLKIKEVENYYSTDANQVNGNAVASVKVGLWYGPVNRSNSAVNGEVYKYEYYYPVTGKTLLTRTENREMYYAPGSSTADVAVTELLYEYVAGKNLTRSVTSQDSKGNQVKQVFYYPFDYNFADVNASHPALGFLNYNKILNPVVARETWLIKNGVNYLTEATVQDYKIIGNGSVRQYKSYALKTGQPIPESSLTTFNVNSIFRDVNLFKETNSIDVFNDKGNAEQVTANKMSTSSIMHDPLYNTEPVANIKNAKLSEVAYSNFEEIDPSVTPGIFGNFAMTGNTVVSDAFAGQRSYTGNLTATLPAGTYVISYWCKNGTPIIWLSGQVNIMRSIRSTNGWNLYRGSIKLTGSSNDISVITGSSIVDEVKIYPQRATMTTVVYGPGALQCATLDENDLITYYEYDHFKRLLRVRDFERNIIKQYDYVYQLPVTGFKSKLLSGTFTKNDCAVGVGESLIYSVPADKYSSLISQEDADQKAAEEAQGYVNTNAGCVVLKPVINSYSYPSQRVVQLNFTPVTGCTSTSITYVDLTTGVPSSSNWGGCVSPRTITVPFSFRTYRVKITCYTASNPTGIESDTKDIYIPF